jgi:hypothetical protein
VYSPVDSRLNTERRASLQNQWDAIAAWQEEINARFSTVERDAKYHGCAPVKIASTSPAGACAFGTYVDRCIADIIGKGVHRFDELLCALPGVYPIDVMAALGRLGLRVSVEPCDTRRVDVDEREGTRFLPRGLLPVPHPLDYDWRFSGAAKRLLVALAEQLATRKSTVAILDAPTVFAEAMARGTQRRFVLFDSNPITTAVLGRIAPAQSVFCVDLQRDDIGPLDARVVVADPPWYPEHIASFLWATRQVLQVGGQALLSLPPLGTRPGIEAERQEIVAYAGRLGLSLLRIDAGVLPYLSPPFEQNALGAEGLPAIPLTWRRGDLAILTCDGPCSESRPATPPHQQAWTETMLGSVRIRFRPTTNSTFANPQLRSIVGGDVLASVSRRHPVRSQAEVWTSGNRVFACEAPSLLGTIAAALVGRQAPAPWAVNHVGRELFPQETILIERAADQLRTLVALETSELRRHAIGADHMVLPK